MLRGDPIWHTSSTGPMSMPSSSDAVATSNLVQHFADLLVRRHRVELAAGQFDGQIELSAVSDVDDGAARTAGCVAAFGAGADQQTRDALERALRRRKADAHRLRLRHVLEALQRQRQM